MPEATKKHTDPQNLAELRFSCSRPGSLLDSREAHTVLNRTQPGLSSLKTLYSAFYQGLSLLAEGKYHIVAVKGTHRIPETRYREDAPNMKQTCKASGGTQGKGEVRAQDVLSEPITEKVRGAL